MMTTSGAVVAVLRLHGWPLVKVAAVAVAVAVAEYAVGHLGLSPELGASLIGLIGGGAYAARSPYRASP